MEWDPKAIRVVTYLYDMDNITSQEKIFRRVNDREL